MIKETIKKLVDTLIWIESFFVKIEKSERRRILILRKDGLGDYLLFYPTLQYYRNLYPDHEIFIVVSTIAKDLIKKMSWIDSFILFDKRKFSSNILYRRKFLLDLKRKNFEIALYPVVTREPVGDFMIKITNAKQKIAFNTTPNTSNTYTKLIDIPKEIHTEIDADLYFAKALGAPTGEIRFPTIKLNESELEGTNLILKKYNLEHKNFCVIFPGSNYPFKIWPVENWASVIHFLIQKEIIPVICGSPHEHTLAEMIKGYLKKDDHMIDLTGKTGDIFTLAGILQKALFYVGSDTGIAHLSAAVAIPTLCLMGGGHFGRFFPYGDLSKNKIIYDHTMKCMHDNWKCVKDILGKEPAPCIRSIKPEEVRKEIESLLGKNIL